MATLLKYAVKTYWDDRKLRDQAKVGKSRTIRRGAALVRSIMRNSIKFGKDAAPVGSPPHAHTKGGGIKNLILWDFDPRTESAIIGPAFKPDAAPNIAPVPGTLEKGGRSRIRLSKRWKRELKKDSIVVTIKPRPFAVPALEKFEAKYPELWEGAFN